MKRECNIEETEKKHKAKQLVLFAKSPSSGGTSGGFFRKKRSKKIKSKSKPRLANTSCHTCGEKGHWTLECSKKRENKAEQAKSGGSTHVAIKLSKNWKVGKMLIAVFNSHEIRQVDMASIINTVNGVLLDCTVISYIFSEQYLFSLYYFLTNIGFVTLTMILSNDTSKLTFTDTLHILILEADLISLEVLYYKDASV